MAPPHAVLTLMLGGLLHLAGMSSSAFVGNRINTIGGPFRTVVERFERCEGVVIGEGGEGDVLLNVRRVSRPAGLGPGARPQRVTGNLTLHQGLNDSMTVSLTIDKWSNNQWKRNAFIIRVADLCSFMKGAGVLGDASCPATKGVYPFTDLEMGWRIPVIPEFHYGRWRAKAEFGAAGAPGPVGCTQFLFQTTPAMYDD